MIVFSLDKDRVPQSDTLGIKDGFITGLRCTMTVSDIINEFYVDGNGHIEIDRNADVATGTVIGIVDDSTGETVASFTLVFLADINGDGFVGTSDLSMLKAVLNGGAKLHENSAQWLSADLNGDGIISSTDVTYMRSVLNGAMEL